LDAKIAGFSTVLFPFEVGGDRAQLAQKLRDLKIEPGLSVNPETSAEEIQPYLHLFSQVVLLAVQPGYQGQQYIEQTTEKAQKLSGMKGVFKIEVDGGISTENTARVSQAGADYLVAGSSLFQNGSPAATYKKLQCSR
jgi:ribulose-phosphate 3-epimerase